jgi:hypothetical protein
MSQQTESSNTHLYSDEQAPSTKPPQLSETIWHLPRQYVKVLFRPSAKTFREEMGKAGWGIVLIQFYLLLVITVVLSYLGHVIPSSALHTTSTITIGAFKPFGFLPLRKHVTMRTLRTFEQALSQSGGRKYRKQTIRVRRA